MFYKLQAKMKFLKKLIIPFLLIVLVSIIYTTYFAGNKRLELFTSFDINNNANKDIRVNVLQDQGTNSNPQSGNQYNVEVPAKENRQSVEIVTLKGHPHADHFYATKIEID